MIIRKNKYLFVLIIAFGMISFLVSGCSTENDEPSQESLRQGISNETDEHEWNGPTEGPWSYWDRNYYPDQHFYWSYQVRNVSDDRIIHEGWLEITTSNTNEGLTRFDYEATIDTKSEWDDPYEYDGMFVLDGQRRENFTHATYENIAEGQLSEAVHEAFSLLDINPLSPYPVGSAYPYIFYDEDFDWEVGTIVTGNNETMKIIATDEIAGIPGLVIEVDAPSFLGEDVAYKYVVNPDLRYPLYLRMTDQYQYTEYILQEYNYSFSQ